MAVSCEHGIELSDSIKDGDFIDQLIDYRFLKDSVPWYQLLIFKELPYGSS
jgi:hypothetical protein